MGGAPISCNPVPPVSTCTFPTAVTVLTQPSPYPPSKLSVFVFEDDFPLNGEQDGGGGLTSCRPRAWSRRLPNPPLDAMVATAILPDR